jgi:Xaa-Pro dipeptidase
MRKTPDAEIERRLSRLSDRLDRLGVHCAILFQNVDRFYYSGTAQDGVLLVRCGGEPVLFVKRTLERARQESPIQRVVGYLRIREVYEYIADHGLHTERVGLEMDTIPAKYYLGLTRFFPSVEFVDISKEILHQRSVKSEHEIALMREGGLRLDRVFGQLGELMRPGMTEYDLFGTVMELFRRQNAILLVRTRSYSMEVLPVTLLSGPNAARHSAMDSPSGGGEGVSVAFPAGPGRRVIGKGEPVLIDVAFNYDGYVIDCTRIFSYGNVGDEHAWAHGVSAGCHDIFREKARDGVFIPDLFREIAGYVDRQGLSDVFMGGVAFIGHGVGLELDEFPVLSEGFEGRLERGMTVAFEPKFIYRSGGVGYENTYLIGERGAESLNGFDGAIQAVEGG